MTITDIKLFPIREPKGSLRASGSMVLENMVRVSFKLIEGTNGLFVSMPSEPFQDKDGNKKYAQHVKFVNEEDRTAVQEAVLEEWNKLQNTTSGNGTRTSAPKGPPTSKRF